MPSYKSFFASVVADGEPLDEYNIETSEKDGLTTVYCWVPSIAGKQYEIQWKDLVLKETSDGQVRIDGNKCGGKVLIKKNGVATKRGFRTSLTSSKPFIFSDLKMTDDEDPFALGMPGNIGEIELRIQYFPLSGQRTPYKVKSLPAEQTYNEKAKKGIDHQTRFGDIVFNERPVSSLHGKHIGKVFLKFLFRYRPLDVLRAHGIAPPARNDLPRPSKRPRSPAMEGVNPSIAEIIEISDEDTPQKEIEKLQRRLDELEAKHPDIRDRKKVKREPGIVTVKTEGSEHSGEPVLIDLT
ncbi:hypothetical protein J3R30DRAFT_3486766 [Lentinula aciculospora]|uniref:DUF7918 domain-containing protein n=1 Tax=Lentinula aciculospora TaxID=153920 RepID=A0A9W9AAJ3_9AGAR|nr:hypothetical protein J3R30DRAFT_3486766 [Lentinula aciculospora]